MATATSISSPTTLAVLLGVSECPRCPSLSPLPQAAYSAKSLHNYLKGKYLALPSDNILNLFDSNSTAADQLEVLEEWLADRQAAMDRAGISARDLLFYYSGHAGYTSGDRAYFLATRRTKAGSEGATSIRYVDLANALKGHAGKLRRYMILDCCFAASASKVYMSAELTRFVANITDYLPPTGTALLCSSAAKEASIAPTGSKFTMFSGALIETLKCGIRDRPPLISLADLGEHMRHVIRTKFGDEAVRLELHVPEQTKGDVAAIPFFPNRAAARTEDDTAASNSAVPDAVPRPRMPPRSIESVAAYIRQFQDESSAKSNWYLIARRAAHDVLAFSLGLPYLFYSRLPHTELFDSAPLTWVVGAMHINNLARYWGENDADILDFNDFDSAALAPFTWDIVRFTTSIALARDSLRLQNDSQELASRFLATYSKEVEANADIWTRDNSSRSKPVDRLFKEARWKSGELTRSASEILKRERLKPCNGPAARKVLKSIYQELGAGRRDGEFYKPVKIWKRHSGLRSLQHDRYLVMIRGDGTEDGARLLDVKVARKSEVAALYESAQPRWPNEAVRIVNVRRRTQATTPAFLSAVKVDGRVFVTKEMRYPSRSSPHQLLAEGKGRILAALIDSAASVAAICHLRGAGWQGADALESLVGFASGDAWHAPMLAATTKLTKQVVRDFREGRRILLKSCQFLSAGI